MALTVVMTASAINAPGVSISWKLDKGIDNPTSAVVSVDDLFTYTAHTVGTELVQTADNFQTARAAGDKTESLFQPTVSNAGSPSPEAALHFKLKPKKGLTFAPKSLSFVATKWGTGGGKLDCDVIVNGKATKLVTGSNPARNNETPPYTEYNLDLSALPATGDEVEVVIYIYALADTKQYGVADVLITGDVNGEVQEVPVYTLSVGSNMEEAGIVRVTPTGTEFEEGTLISVEASENFSYHFGYWADANGNKVSEANPYSFEINANTSLTAVYTKSTVYTLDVDITGGAAPYHVTRIPAGYIENGKVYYEEGTEVLLRTWGNRIISFTSWDDNSTSPERTVIMNGDINVTANFSAADYIVGWDLYNDSPNSERAADFKAETDNAGLLSLHNASGATTSWLTRGIVNGQEGGRYAARIWKLRSDKNYFEISFSSKNYKNLVLVASLGCNSYNTYSRFFVEYSIDGGATYNKCDEYAIQVGWTDKEITLPADAAGVDRLFIRFIPDFDAPLVGNETDYDGVAIADIYVLADAEMADDDIAPRLVSTIPANGSTDASATGSIVLTFDEKVKVGTGDVTLGGEVLTPKAAGNAVVYNYAGLDYGTEYTFILPEGAIVDRSGNKAPACEIKFTTMQRVQPEVRLFDAIVAKDGSGDYTSVQAAIDAAPEGRVKPWLIFVKNGNYKEHVDIPKSKPFMHIIGQNRDKTVILDDQLCGGETAVHVSVGATVVVNANDCFFENITLENSYGHEKQTGPQALALNTIGDRAIFNNVAMLSYQDTWITSSNSKYRAYVRNSLIEGAVDFIYNSGDLYVENTTLYINRKSGGYIVAPSHALDVAWGYVFNNCTITAPGNPVETSIWLGRPWHNYPKTVFLNTRAEVTIPAAGWYETMGGLPVIWADWNTTDINGNPVDLSQRRDTYYKTENGEKIYGKAKNHLTDEEAAEYTVKNVLSGSDAWQPVIKTESCAAPAPVIDNNGLITWDPVPYAICYLITDGDDVVEFVTETSYQTLTRAAGNYTVQAVNEFGGLSVAAKVTNGAGINAVDTDSTPVMVIYHDIYGRQLGAPAPGVNIVTRIDAAGNRVTTKEVYK